MSATPAPTEPAGKPDEEPDGPAMTVDELARRAGISVRTIRFYAGKGLLPPPRLRGRLGLYGPDHLARLELISDLTALGFTLAAVERLLDRLPTSVTPEDLVLQRALLVPWLPERPEPVDAAELDRRAGRTLTPVELRLLRALGAVEPDPERAAEGGLLLLGSSGLAAALAGLDLGLRPEVLVRLHELIHRHTAALAEELMAVFQDEVLQPYRDRGRPVAERARLRELFTRLKPITVQGVTAAFGRAVNRAIRQRYGDAR